MNNNWENYKKHIEYPKSGILSKVFSQFEKINITLFCMAKETNISKHTSTKAGVVLILEGQGMFNLSGENIVMEPGVIIYMDKNAEHSLKAIKNTAFLLVLFN